MPDLWSIPNSRIEQAAEAFKGPGWQAVSTYKTSGLWADVLLRQQGGTAQAVVTVYADTYHCKEH